MTKKTAQKKKPLNRGWKSARDYNQSAKRTKLALAVLVLIVLLLLMGKAVNLIVNFNQPLSKSSQVYRQRVWDKNSNINVVIKTNTVSLVSYDPVEKRVLILNLPNELFVTVPGGFGNWQIGSVYGLGQADKDKIGGKLLKSSIANFLGVPVDGYIEFDSKYEDKSAKELANLLKDGLMQAISFLPHIKSDLSSSELLSFTMGMNGVRFDKVEEIDLTKLNLLDKTFLADGTGVYTSDPDRIDSVGARFTDSKLSAEKISVAILNGTDTPGVAQKAGRFISNLGGNVIILANAPKREATAVFIEGSEKELGYTPTRLAQLFTSDCSSSLKCDIIICNIQQKSSLKEKCALDDPNILNSRAEINIILGEDFLSR